MLLYVLRLRSSRVLAGGDRRKNAADAGPKVCILLKLRYSAFLVAEVVQPEATVCASAGHGNLAHAGSK